MRHGCLVIGVVLLLCGGRVAGSGAEVADRDRPAAGCAFLAAEHILAVTVKLTPAEEGRGQAYVVRNGDLIEVFGGPDADRVTCHGGLATVANTDYVLVRAGNRVTEPQVAIDMRRGVLGPGFTDERDGTSEVEVFADLGPRANVVVATTSDPDHATVGPSGGDDVVNVNAGEAVDDADVFAPPDSVTLYGGAGGDLLEGSASPRSPGAPAEGAVLVGGGGPDLLIGTDGIDLLQGDGGGDLLAAGGATDIVLGRDRGRDRIDCGTGNDTYVVVDRQDRLAGCEKHSFEDLSVPNARLKRVANRFRSGWRPVRSPSSPITAPTMSSPASAGR